MRYSLRDFLPLIIIFSGIILFTLLCQWIMGSWQLIDIMHNFMAAFFIIFGTFKIINWHGFAEAYAMYDLIAQRSTIYAYAYPLIELSLGVAYLFRIYPMATNFITFIVMLISSIGVALELIKGRSITCACLGVVFKIPMTYVTLFEDVLMAGMAFGMLLHYLI